MVNSAASFDSSLWSATVAEPAIETAPLAGRITTDVAIVGGGYTGLSAALSLAEVGTNVVVLEAEAFGYGASGRNGGQVIPGLKLDPSEMIAKWGEQRGRALAEAVGNAADAVFSRIARHGIQCVPKCGGWIQAAHSDRALDRVIRRAQDWSAFGAPVEVLSQQEVTRRIGTREYVGGWIDRRAGTLQPLGYVRGLARAAIAAGAQLHQKSRVLKVTPAGKRWHIFTSNGSVDAAAVILATDAYTDGVMPKLARSLLPVQSIQIATTPLPQHIASTILPGGECVSETRQLAFYFRLTPDGRLLMGGRGSIGEQESEPLYAALHHAMRRLFPQAALLPIEYRWSGQVGLTLDGLPRIHEPAPGMFIGFGYNGRGIAMATLMGEWLAARLHRGIEAPLPNTELSPIPWHGLRKPVIGLGIAWAWTKDRMGIAA
ncbi:FAD-binding oxidoreductase [Bradyrhizobium lablabi]|uniref:NAD(P)/FAD-dependent oxidoreductase n=1 Tax=Bradyrhizobium lablabi TaxID=722472 RepID=UPI001BA816E6|nr:FAD-binding oxidoreductase [Bradyrhizobium lablabi]MBR1125936.1 FAD-binding oxidoreductase [Bradyrhizobium lablabi]